VAEQFFLSISAGQVPATFVQNNAQLSIICRFGSFFILF
jgi:hypothetical protein